jgi:hypothetical protein
MKTTVNDTSAALGFPWFGDGELKEQQNRSAARKAWYQGQRNKLLDLSEDRDRALEAWEKRCSGGDWPTRLEMLQRLLIAHKLADRAAVLAVATVYRSPEQQAIIEAEAEHEALLHRQLDHIMARVTDPQEARLVFAHIGGPLRERKVELFEDRLQRAGLLR